ncbi:MAG: HAD family hydrolase [Dehalococcoidia bacterium]
MTIKAVLFDVGGPLDTEVIHEWLFDVHIREALQAEGVRVDDARFAEANRWAVDSFAWNAYEAIVWRLSGGDADLSRRVMQRVIGRNDERRVARDGIELRDGVPELLKSLHERGLRIGLAANQPQAILEALDRRGVGRYFDHREVSGTHGYRKPDVRLFLRACDDLSVAPQECIMVGDRIDNDIVPARWLGMRAILFRTGRHIEQQARSWREVPDAEVRDVAELTPAIDAIVDAEASADTADR